MPTQLNLLQGTLDLLVLKALVFGPRHGYEIARWVRGITEGALEIDDGALYTSLHRMAKRGWVAAEWGVTDSNRRARYYSLTREGRRQLNAETRHWTEYAEAVFKVLRAVEASS